MANLRFYTNETLAIGGTFQLCESAATHATKALRLNIGDKATVFNGDGFDYGCELTSITKNKVLASINNAVAVQNESPLDITLLQAISAGDRMDFTIQKAVELGVKCIQPVTSQRSVVKLSAERAEKRTEHWQNIAISACEQSGRAFVPKVNAPLSFSNLFLHLAKTAKPEACKITLTPDANQTLHTIAKPSGEIYLLIGAEGGLTNEEIALSVMQGFQSILLGPRILRTETAALTALSAIQTLWGDFK
ncbi:MAG: 16S rRNA (uracil(1498)-N(3))-methyltransferase [Methylotenera sp.]|nr:16S rRNA (uracil(1498)-N(3))-methyltransferase [Methylotenera sp.]